MSVFLSEIPGVSQARVENPAGYVAPDGAAVFVLGDQRQGFTQRLARADGMAIHQTVAVGAGKLIRFRGRIRGPNSPPPAMTQVVEPFALADGQVLGVQIDNDTTRVITFNAADFVAIGAATALEVRDAINAQIGAGAVARLNGVGGVEIRTEETGRRARVAIDHDVTTAVGLNFEEMAWFALLMIAGSVHARVEIRAGETRDLSDVAARVEPTTSPEVRFALELDTK